MVACRRVDRACDGEDSCATKKEPVVRLVSEERMVRAYLELHVLRWHVHGLHGLAHVWLILTIERLFGTVIARRVVRRVRRL